MFVELFINMLGTPRDPFATVLMQFLGQVLRDLLHFSADVNRPDQFGWVPLGACKTVTAVQMLVQHQADVNKTPGQLLVSYATDFCLKSHEDKFESDQFMNQFCILQGLAVQPMYLP